MRERAFTLIELIVVIMVIAILSALLFPVFQRARAQGTHAVCATQLKQLGLATGLYASEYDDGLMPAQYRSDTDQTPVYDRRWPQLLLPYTRNFKMFRCPSDTFKHPDTSLNDPSSLMRDADALAYRWAERTNYGYNALNLSPAYYSGSEWYVAPVQQSQVTNPSGTILFAETAWEISGGRTTGGGNYIVLPPCRFSFEGGASLDTLGSVSPVYNQASLSPGWSLDFHDKKLVYGGAWAFHGGTMNQAMLDGAVVRRSLPASTVGCDMKPRWQGRIIDRGAYLWDAN
ncbi:MAG: prepilin-type N-terminal cleavage/methylation domain-containing protein [Chthonomonas sp.]|nr:prepilin-type N-terminal cleavage/methylation domain-containing protein [Chthonomonas sp.]